MKAVFVLVAAAVVLGGCSHDNPLPVQSETASEETLKKDCADPQWKQQNLGLWYSVCRQPLHW